MTPAISFIWLPSRSGVRHAVALTDVRAGLHSSSDEFADSPAHGGRYGIVMAISFDAALSPHADVADTRMK
jgi:hypothetical protein